MIYCNQTKKFSLSKTLRFELKPVLADGSPISDFSIFHNTIKKDKERAAQYQAIKPMIDECHKAFIDKVLAEKEIFTQEKLEWYISNKEILKKSSSADTEREKSKKIVEATEKDWCKNIFETFTKHADYKNLFGKELFAKDGHLRQRFKDNEDIKNIDAFEKFTTYFKGFETNRKNMYVAEKQVTSIANRLVHENLPKFLGNVERLKKAFEDYPDLKEIIEKNQNRAWKKLSIENGFSIDSLMLAHTFNKTMTQKGIEDYNECLGGRTAEGQEKIQGINEILNLYRQQKNLTKKDLPSLVTLYKQILADRETNSMVFKPFEKVEDVYLAIETQCSTLYKRKTELEEWIKKMPTTANNVWIDKTCLTTLSTIIFGEGKWGMLSRIMGIAVEYEEDDSESKTKKTSKKNNIDKQKFFSLNEINHTLEDYKTDDTEIKTMLKGGLGKITEKGVVLLTNFCKEWEKIVPTLKQDETPKTFNAEQKKDVKLFLDLGLEVVHWLKMFTDNPDNKDEIFYTEWQSFLDDWKLLTKIYDKTRNFASKKGYSTDQIKINFDNGTLLNGWDCNKESDNMGVLLEKNGEFFLGITIDNKIFDYQWDIDNYQAPESKASIKKSNLKKQITANSEEKSWNKMVYKLLPGPNKMLPKVFFLG